MKRKYKVTLSVVASVALVAGASAYFAFGYSKKHAETKSYTIGDGASVKVGILSDTQLPSGGRSDSSQITALKSTLEYLKNQQVEAIILAGDFTDLGTKSAWQSFKDTYDGVFSDNKPVPVFAMGNHDYWLPMFKDCFEIATPAKMQKRFTSYTGEYPYSHKVINGFHFIVWSSSDGSYDLSYNDDKWIRAQLDAAVADTPGKPIFVITHLHPSDTVYGSDDWGNKDIYNVLKDYPQVVSFSGHSHYALCDERSVWQGEFTAINTQTTDYIELESGKFNGTIPVDAYGNDACHYPTCMIMDVNSEKITINRVAVNSGESIKEPWVIGAPFGDKSSFTYTSEARIKSNTAPYFTGESDIGIYNEKDKDGKAISVIKFNAAADDDFVHSYRLEFLDENGTALPFTETKYDGAEKENAKEINKIEYFSDFALGLDKMSQKSALRLPDNIPGAAVKIRITAMDTWGKESNSIEAIIAEATK
ncbi:MAG: hypothetical protein GX051_09530 [Clostridiales bacterium]|nr:hypothetical protein [Clostridiales bacterium]